ncbi:hypothetical protein EV182_005679 [Spiromyces aspiralis]|uniref:Uncharacterized protein n=1 Tax=Spiromyces aspiralis TaxID=68401 RepID=A0ACC1HD03_9FUNG|nr:hypothetical protein EV182_005679 [Spiromyces aspiralis]
MGVMWIKSQTLMKGYYKDPKATAKVFDKDGFYCIGDVCKFDQGNNMYLYGRDSDMIHYHGQIVPPSEIEALIREYPGVKYSAVVGVYSPKYKTEVAYAYIVSETAAPGDDASDLVTWLDSQVINDAMKLHAGAEFIEDLPKSTAGKLYRMRLKQMYYEKTGMAEELPLQQLQQQPPPPPVLNHNI